MSVRILRGDVRDRLRDLPDESVHCVVTSPPYWGLRDYGVAGQIGLEETPGAFVEALVDVFREVRRVLRADGTAWLNLGDSYAGSGRGGHVSDTSTLQGSIEHEQECKRARGSQLAPGLHAAAAAAGVIGRAWVAAPAGLKQKDLVGVPWRVAFALQADGWYLRQDIIWHKPNPMPESVRDRCTKAHEYIFLLAKAGRYYFDADAIAEAAAYPEGNGNTFAPDAVPGLAEHNNRSGIHEIGPRPTRNKRSVWTVNTSPFPEAHFATFPPALIEPCILAGCPVGGTVLDPFFGAGTTGLVADRLQRDCIGIELNPEYADMAERRIKGDSPLFAQVGT